MGVSFWIFQLFKFIVLALVAYLSGLLAQKKLLKVNYTRKINHFAISFLPELLLILFAISNTKNNVIVSTAITILYFLFFIKPIRSRIQIFATMFAAIDRPEDRPFTLRWFILQYIVAIIVIIPFYFYFSSIGKLSMVYIALFINNIGDGLAEPIGIRFGKHKYTTKAIFIDKKYIRTIEGSLCVFITSIILLVISKNDFSIQQFYVSLLTVPFVATIAEAKSPHTMDAPFIIGFTSLSLLLIQMFL
jgi:dolichol kinase